MSANSNPVDRTIKKKHDESDSGVSSIHNQPEPSKEFCFNEKKELSAKTLQNAIIKTSINSDDHQPSLCQYQGDCDEKAKDNLHPFAKNLDVCSVYYSTVKKDNSSSHEKTKREHHFCDLDILNSQHQETPSEDHKFVINQIVQKFMNTSNHNNETSTIWSENATSKNIQNVPKVIKNDSSVLVLPCKVKSGHRKRSTSGGDGKSKSKNHQSPRRSEQTQHRMKTMAKEVINIDSIKLPTKTNRNGNEQQEVYFLVMEKNRRSRSTSKTTNQNPVRKNELFPEKDVTDKQVLTAITEKLINSATDAAKSEAIKLHIYENALKNRKFRNCVLDSSVSIEVMDKAQIDKFLNGGRHSSKRTHIIKSFENFVDNSSKVSKDVDLCELHSEAASCKKDILHMTRHRSKSKPRDSERHRKRHKDIQKLQANDIEAKIKKRHKSPERPLRKKSKGKYRKEISFTQLNLTPVLDFYKSSPPLELDRQPLSKTQPKTKLVRSRRRDASSNSINEFPLKNKREKSSRHKSNLSRSDRRSSVSEIVTRKEKNKHKMQHHILANYFDHAQLKRSVYSKKKVISTDRLLEISTKSLAEDGSTSLGFTVEGIEPPKRLEPKHKTIDSDSSLKHEAILNRLHFTFFPVLEVKATGITLSRPSSCLDLLKHADVVTHGRRRSKEKEKNKLEADGDGHADKKQTKPKDRDISKDIKSKKEDNESSSTSQEQRSLKSKKLFKYTMQKRTKPREIRSEKLDVIFDKKCGKFVLREIEKKRSSSHKKKRIHKEKEPEAESKKETKIQTNTSVQEAAKSEKKVLSNLEIINEESQSHYSSTDTDIKHGNIIKPKLSTIKDEVESKNNVLNQEKNKKDELNSKNKPRRLPSMIPKLISNPTLNKQHLDDLYKMLCDTGNGKKPPSTNLEESLDKLIKYLQRLKAQKESSATKTTGLLFSKLNGCSSVSSCSLSKTSINNQSRDKSLNSSQVDFAHLQRLPYENLPTQYFALSAEKKKQQQEEQQRAERYFNSSEYKEKMAKHGFTEEDLKKENRNEAVSYGVNTPGVSCISLVCCVCKKMLNCCDHKPLPVEETPFPLVQKEEPKPYGPEPFKMPTIIRPTASKSPKLQKVVQTNITLTTDLGSPFKTLSHTTLCSVPSISPQSSAASFVNKSNNKKKVFKTTRTVHDSTSEDTLEAKRDKAKRTRPPRKKTPALSKAISITEVPKPTKNTDKSSKHPFLVMSTTSSYTVCSNTSEFLTRVERRLRRSRADENKRPPEEVVNNGYRLFDHDSFSHMATNSSSSIEDFHNFQARSLIISASSRKRILDTVKISDEALNTILHILQTESSSFQSKRFGIKNPTLSKIDQIFQAIESPDNSNGDNNGVRSHKSPFYLHTTSSTKHTNNTQGKINMLKRLITSTEDFELSVDSLENPNSTRKFLKPRSCMTFQKPAPNTYFVYNAIIETDSPFLKPKLNTIIDDPLPATTSVDTDTNNPESPSNESSSAQVSEESGYESIKVSKKHGLKGFFKRGGLLDLFKMKRKANNKKKEDEHEIYEDLTQNTPDSLTDAKSEDEAVLSPKPLASWSSVGKKIYKFTNNSDKSYSCKMGSDSLESVTNKSSEPLKKPKTYTINFNYFKNEIKRFSDFASDTDQSVKVNFKEEVKTSTTGDDSSVISESANVYEDSLKTGEISEKPNEEVKIDKNVSGILKANKTKRPKIYTINFNQSKSIIRTFADFARNDKDQENFLDEGPALGQHCQNLKEKFLKKKQAELMQASTSYKIKEELNIKNLEKQKQHDEFKVVEFATELEVVTDQSRTDISLQETVGQKRLVKKMSKIPIKVKDSNLRCNVQIQCESIGNVDDATSTKDLRDEAAVQTNKVNDVLTQTSTTKKEKQNFDVQNDSAKEKLVLDDEKSLDNNQEPSENLETVFLNTNLTNNQSGLLCDPSIAKEKLPKKETVETDLQKVFPFTFSDNKENHQYSVNYVLKENCRGNKPELSTKANKENNQLLKVKLAQALNIMNSKENFSVTSLDVQYFKHLVESTAGHYVEETDIKNSNLGNDISKFHVKGDKNLDAPVSGNSVKLYEELLRLLSELSISRDDPALSQFLWEVYNVDNEKPTCSTDCNCVERKKSSKKEKTLKKEKVKKQTSGCCKNHKGKKSSLERMKKKNAAKRQVSAVQDSASRKDLVEVKEIMAPSKDPIPSQPPVVIFSKKRLSSVRNSLFTEDAGLKIEGKDEPKKEKTKKRTSSCCTKRKVLSDEKMKDLSKRKLSFAQESASEKAIKEIKDLMVSSQEPLTPQQHEETVDNRLSKDHQGSIKNLDTPDDAKKKIVDKEESNIFALKTEASLKIVRKKDAIQEIEEELEEKLQEVTLPDNDSMMKLVSSSTIAQKLPKKFLFVEERIENKNEQEIENLGVNGAEMFDGIREEERDDYKKLQSGKKKRVSITTDGKILTESETEVEKWKSSSNTSSKERPRKSSFDRKDHDHKKRVSIGTEVKEITLKTPSEEDELKNEKDTNVINEAKSSTAKFDAKAEDFVVTQTDSILKAPKATPIEVEKVAPKPLFHKTLSHDSSKEISGIFDEQDIGFDKQMPSMSGEITELILNPNLGLIKVSSEDILAKENVAISSHLVEIKSESKSIQSPSEIQRFSLIPRDSVELTIERSKSLQAVLEPELQKQSQRKENKLFKLRKKRKQLNCSCDPERVTSSCKCAVESKIDHASEMTTTEKGGQRILIESTKKPTKESGCLCNPQTKNQRCQCCEAELFPKEVKDISVTCNVQEQPSVSSKISHSPKIKSNEKPAINEVFVRKPRRARTEHESRPRHVEEKSTQRSHRRSRSFQRKCTDKTCKDLKNNKSGNSSSKTCQCTQKGFQNESEKTCECRLFSHQVKQCQEYAVKVRLESDMRRDGYWKQYTDFKEIPLHVLLGRPPTVHHHAKKTGVVATQKSSQLRQPSQTQSIVEVVVEKQLYIEKEEEEEEPVSTITFPQADSLLLHKEILPHEPSVEESFPDTFSDELNQIDFSEPEIESSSSKFLKAKNSSNVLAMKHKRHSTSESFETKFKDPFDKTQERHSFIQGETLKLRQKKMDQIKQIIEDSETRIFSKESDQDLKSAAAAGHKVKNVDEVEAHKSAKEHTKGITFEGSQPKQPTIEEVRKNMTDKEIFNKVLHNYEKEDDLAERLSYDEEFFTSQLTTVRSKSSATEFLQDEDTKKAFHAKSDAFVDPQDIGTTFARGFTPKHLTLTGDTCKQAVNPDKARLNGQLTEDESIIDFSERDTPLDYLLGLGFMVDEATNALKDEDVEHRLLAAITEARVWINQITTTQGTLLYLVAYKAKPKTMRYFLQLVEAVINKRITNVVKLDGFLRVLEKIEQGEIGMMRLFKERQFEDEENEQRLVKSQLREIFMRVYKTAEYEAHRSGEKLSKKAVMLLRILSAKYRAGLNPHLELIATYIGRGTLKTDVQLEGIVCPRFLVKFKLYLKPRNW